MFERGSRLPTALPAAIVVDVTCSLDGTLDSFFEWLLPFVRDLACDVPFYILTGGDDDIPQGVQPTAVINRTVPDDVLLMLICIHQRAILRFEEAQLRRNVFGRIPGFGSAPHHSGTSSLMVVGVSGRFLEWQDAIDEKFEVVGAFDGSMAVEFMALRAFDAVVVDAPFEDAVDYIQQIRRDARFAGLPVLAVCEDEDDTVHLFRNGASDVLMGENRKDTLASRLATAIRFGKRRRLADRGLAESRMWLRQQINHGGLDIDYYNSYLDSCSAALAVRGLDLWEMRLQPENFGIEVSSPDELEETYSTLLSIADATSREEDLVCLVKDMGPVAVLKNEQGTLRLQNRINMILRHTVRQGTPTGCDT
ncbi:response regulator transcription factor [Labrenzia aggregata]|uniref:Response regulator transcription factor n=2 Tax=Roseibium aggregatum TaxID=187304 RepID=A0A939EFG4_9HYPH|nr:response regulator transcription factor [Roseibium aggregatum]